MSFIGREGELERLKKFLAAPGQSAALIYGRRRVGKSELLLQALRAHSDNFIYLECRESSERSNVQALSEAISQALQLPQLSFGDFESALSFLFEQARHREVVLALDEYPNLRATVKGADSILQVLLDTYHRSGQLKLLLCGSDMATMQSLFYADNPLYGRIDLIIDLKPMDYFESALFYPEFSCEDRVRLYCVFGGIPYYNRLIDPTLSVSENLMTLLTAPGARLENEILFYLKSELSKLSNANEVFEALSRGYSRFSDLLAQSAVSSSPSLAAILDRLVQLELVRRETPINDHFDRKKNRYYISDRLTLFYYRYLFRHASARAVLSHADFYQRHVADDFETQFVPHGFEEIARQYLIRQNRSGKLTPAFDKIGRYAYNLPSEHRKGEFDVVTCDPEGYVFYEVQFSQKPLDDETVRTEMAQANATGLKCHRYVFITSSGSTAVPRPEVDIITLPELYES